MNTSAPLPPEQLDELLSADLDGEFDAAARDLGLEPAEARERIALTPGATERQLALAVAQATLADVSALDEKLAERLRAKAANALNDTHEDELAARRRKRYRVVAAVGAVAAAVAVILGVVATSNSSDDSSKTAAASSATQNGGARFFSPAATTPVTLNLGEAKTTDDLAKRLNLQLESRSAAENDSSQFAASNADTAIISSGADKVAAPPAATHQLKTATTSANCDRVAHDLTGVNDAPTLRATGKVGDANVLVYVFRSGNNEIVLMLNTKCQFVYRQARPAS